MTENSARIIYIHGFNSSPASHKAQSLLQYCQRYLPAVSVSIPQLPHDPAEAISRLEKEIDAGMVPKILIGSSLGGYYATYLAEKHDIRAALVNPAVAPARTLVREFLGSHINPHSGYEYELTMDHVGFLATLEIGTLSYPENYLLLVQDADEVLDYKMAVKKYKGSRQIVQSGGSHAFENFCAMIPDILAFADLPNMSKDYANE